jgi:hypothetical protein
MFYVIVSLFSIEYCSKRTSSMKMSGVNRGYAWRVSLPVISGDSMKVKAGSMRVRSHFGTQHFPILLLMEESLVLYDATRSHLALVALIDTPRTQESF